MGTCPHGSKALDRQALVRGLTGRGVHVEFPEEGLCFSEKDSPMITI